MFFESKPKEAEEINSFDNDVAIAEKQNLLVEQEETMKNCEKKSESKSSITFPICRTIDFRQTG